MDKKASIHAKSRAVAPQLHEFVVHLTDEQLDTLHGIQNSPSVDETDSQTLQRLVDNHILTEGSITIDAIVSMVRGLCFRHAKIVYLFTLHLIAGKEASAKGGANDE